MDALGDRPATGLWWVNILGSVLLRGKLHYRVLPRRRGAASVAASASRLQRNHPDDEDWQNGRDLKSPSKNAQDCNRGGCEQPIVFVRVQESLGGRSIRGPAPTARWGVSSCGVRVLLHAVPEVEIQGCALFQHLSPGRRGREHDRLLHDRLLRWSRLLGWDGLRRV